MFILEEHAVLACKWTFTRCLNKHKLTTISSPSIVKSNVHSTSLDSFCAVSSTCWSIMPTIQQPRSHLIKRSSTSLDSFCNVSSMCWSIMPTIHSFLLCGKQFYFRYANNHKRCDDQFCNVSFNWYIFVVLITMDIIKCKDMDVFIGHSERIIISKHVQKTKKRKWCKNYAANDIYGLLRRARWYLGTKEILLFYFFIEFFQQRQRCIIILWSWTT